MRVDSFSDCCGAGELSQLLTVELICESGFIQLLLTVRYFNSQVFVTVCVLGM